MFKKVTINGEKMFRYVENVKINREMSKKELLATIKANKDVKNDASIISDIMLSYILSPATTNLEASKDVKEIYVITLTLKDKRVPNIFLDLLDKQIFFPTLFKMCYNDSVVYKASVKDFADDGTMKILKTYQTDWQEELKQEFPTTSKLENIYKKILSNITNYQFKKEESFQDWIVRTNTIKNLQNEFKKIEKMMKVETQPKKKFAYNDKLREIYEQIVFLKQTKEN